MFRSSKPDMQLSVLTTPTVLTFAEVFEKEMKPLYLLAFLLTADHKQAEHCFASTSRALKEQKYIKEWARSWVKRTLIEKAIAIVSQFRSAAGARDLWSAGHNETPGQDQIDPVTKLRPALRRLAVCHDGSGAHSHSDCALLLGCSTNKVAQARTNALRRLPDFVPLLLPRRQGLPDRLKSAREGDRSVVNYLS